MARIDPSFPYDIFRFLHRPIRRSDEDNDNFIERFLTGSQAHWESVNQSILDVQKIIDPETCRADLLQYLKDIVGFTKELRKITDPLSESDLRKVILLAVPLWKSKGTEKGISNIIRLFTGFQARVFNWFDYRMIVGEKAIGEEQLGEDAWFISVPGIDGSEPVGEALLLLQFDNLDEINDGSIHQNTVITHGSPIFQPGGAHGNSDYYLFGDDFCLKVPFKDIYDFSNGLTFETYFKTNSNDTIDIFSWFDSILNSGIEFKAIPTTNEIYYKIGDGQTTQSASVIPTSTFDDGDWHHVLFEIDWSVGDHGKIAIWVDGTREVYDDLNSLFIPRLLKCEKDLVLFAEEVEGDKFSGGIDAMRLTSDVRYDVTESSITPPATKFLEYVVEQLDEFQIDVRVVDDGTLDRTQLKRILQLMRPISERINILYIDFYDDFSSGKGQYKTVSGSGYTEDTDSVFYLKLPENSFEIVETGVSEDWTNYIAQQRCIIYSGEEFEVRFLIKNDINFYAFRINSNNKLAYFEKVVNGVRTSLATPQTIDVEIASPPLYYPYYVFMVSCFKNENTGVMTLRAFIDSNKIFEVNDSQFNEGTFGLYTPTGSVVWCSETEMFQLPLDYERINPNDVF